MAKRDRVDERDHMDESDNKSRKRATPALAVNPSKRLGNGAYGTVFVGYYHGQDVAIKVSGIDEYEDRVAAVREIDIASTCDHANIMTVVGYGMVTDRETLKRTRGRHRHDEAMWMAMPRCKTTLDAMCKTMDFDAVTRMLCDMCQALNYLHTNGVWHRDVKPSNILYAPDGTWQLCDFGLARRIATVPVDPVQDADVAAKPSMQYTSLVVTRWYRSPELCIGYPYDQSIDTWALMCVAWECARTVTTRARSRIIFAQGGENGSQSVHANANAQERAEYLATSGAMLYEIARRGVFNDPVPDDADPTLAAAYSLAHAAHATPPKSLLANMSAMDGIHKAPVVLKSAIAAGLRAWPSQRKTAAELYQMLCGVECPGADTMRRERLGGKSVHEHAHTMDTFRKFLSGE